MPNGHDPTWVAIKELREDIHELEREVLDRCSAMSSHLSRINARLDHHDEQWTAMQQRQTQIPGIVYAVATAAIGLFLWLVDKIWGNVTP